MCATKARNRKIKRREGGRKLWYYFDFWRFKGFSVVQFEHPADLGKVKILPIREMTIVVQWCAVHAISTDIHHGCSPLGDPCATVLRTRYNALGTSSKPDTEYTRPRPFLAIASHTCG